MENTQTEENDYNPYCPDCGACGEEGCCSPLACGQTPNEQYCSGYLVDLKFGYHMNRWLVNNLLEKLSDEDKKSYDKEWNKSYDEFYGKNNYNT